MLIGMAMALAAASAPTCQPVAGADLLWQAKTQWVIVGETHGTAEMPLAFANLACLAARTRRPVFVAVEFSRDWQPVIDAYLRSNGDAAARKALLALPVWTTQMQDGRGSEAVLTTFESLRRLRRAGVIERVVATDISRSPLGAGQTRDAAVADNWRNVAVPKDGLVLALVGNIHAMRRPLERPTGAIVTAASLLNREQTVTVNFGHNGGTAWNCQADGCGAHSSGADRTAAAGLTYIADPEAPWDAVYELGTVTTASAPAVTRDADRPTG